MDFDDDLLDEIALLARLIVSAAGHPGPGILDPEELDSVLGVAGRVVDLREAAPPGSASMPPSR